jgi:ferredoxin/flavodoxin---NADP+ reductase
VVVGAGNVALNVGRVLTRDHTTLAATDVPSPALRRLLTSRIEEVTVVARRGPEQAKFTAKELREIDGIDPIVSAYDIRSVDNGSLPRAVKSNLAIFEQWSAGPVDRVRVACGSSSGRARS